MALIYKGDCGCLDFGTLHWVFWYIELQFTTFFLSLDNILLFKVLDMFHLSWNIIIETCNNYQFCICKLDISLV